MNMILIYKITKKIFKCVSNDKKNPRNLLSFGGISGGPAFDSNGKINGVVVAEFTRRGLLGVVGIDQINWLLSMMMVFLIKSQVV